MGKQLIHAYIDDSFYLELKSKKINVSGLINNLVKQYLKTENKETKELIELQELLNKARDKRKDADKEIHLLAVRIARLTSEKEEENKKKHNLQDEMAESIIRAGGLR